jgi:hypothetical protein
LVVYTRRFFQVSLLPIHMLQDIPSAQPS